MSLWGVQSSLEHHVEPDAVLSHILKLDIMEQQFSVWRISVHIIVKYAIFKNSGLNANITGMTLKCFSFSFHANGNIVCWFLSDNTCRMWRCWWSPYLWPKNLMLSDRNPDSCVNNEEANKKNKGWAETAASKRVKRQSQNTLTNNKTLILSKSPENKVLIC